MSNKIDEPIDSLNIKHTECSLVKAKNPSAVCSVDIIALLGRAMKVAGTSTKETLEKLKRKTDCGTELCVLNSTEAKENISAHALNKAIETNYKIVGPLGKDWLSNVDIDYILKQLSIEYPDFKHITFQMRDFAINGDLTQYDFCEIVKSNIHKKIGVVLNTDYYSNSGIHWYCIFLDFTSDPATLEFFDSAGNPPLPETHLWLEETLKKLNTCMQQRKTVLKLVNDPVQKDNSSCGVYSLYYLINRTMGVSIDDLKSSGKLNDKNMINLRKHLFKSE
jgi:hypothetical protein